MCYVKHFEISSTLLCDSTVTIVFVFEINLKMYFIALNYPLIFFVAVKYLSIKMMEKVIKEKFIFVPVIFLCLCL